MMPIKTFSLFILFFTSLLFSAEFKPSFNPEPLKILAAKKYAEQLTSYSSQQQRKICGNLPEEIKTELSYQLKVRYWDYLTTVAHVSFAAHGKHAALNHNNWAIASAVADENNHEVVSCTNGAGKTFSLSEKKSSPIQKIAWNPCKLQCAVAQDGFWITLNELSQRIHLSQEALGIGDITNLIWNAKGSLMVIGKGFRIFPPNFENAASCTTIDYRTEYPITHALWIHPHKFAIAYKKGDNVMIKTVEHIDPKKQRELSAENDKNLTLRDIIDTNTFLVSAFQGIGALALNEDKKNYEINIIKSFDARTSIISAFQLNTRYILLKMDSRDDDLHHLILFDRERDKEFEVATCVSNGPIALSHDRTIVYETDDCSALVELNDLIEKTPLIELLKKIRKHKLSSLKCNASSYLHLLSDRVLKECCKYLE